MAVYLVSVCNITNPGPNLKKYAELSAQLIRKHGGKYLVRGKPVESVSGDMLPNRVTIIAEFPSAENFRAFFYSDAYQKDCKPLREGTGIYDIGLFEAPPADKA
jgi:uncharacterized protein (DUF1330 family)